MDFKSEIEERDKLILFLREQLVAATGTDIEIPYKWERLAGVPLGPPVPLANEGKGISFEQAVAQLKLPKAEDLRPSARGTQKPKEKPSPSANLAKISLCNFENRKVAPEVFNFFIEGIKRLGRLHTVELETNGLDDSYIIQIEELFLHKKIRKINLANNRFGKSTALKMSELLKGPANHIEWLEEDLFSVSRNGFARETSACMSFSPAVRKHQSLYHFSITVEGNPSEHIIKSALFNRNIKSLGLPHSRVTNNAMEALFNGLKVAKLQPVLAALDLSHCFLEPRHVVLLANTIKHNRSLVKLDLSYNGFSSNVARFIAEALRFNESLHMLDLSHNELSNVFCTVLANEIRNNETLFQCNLAGNPVEEEGIERILNTLGSSNETLESLGPLEKNSNIGMGIKEKIREKTVSMETEFELLRSLEDTNPEGVFEVLPWNLTDAIIQ